ncbi:Vitamin B12-binding protein [Thermoplasmatales archaeon]|nr:Vitamin B12-binding protein [Thermoplasmatales archaeon]
MNSVMKYILVVVVSALVITSGIVLYSIYKQSPSGDLNYISVVYQNGTKQMINLNNSNSYLIRPDNYNGSTYSFSTPVVKIVSLAPSITSTLYGIGAYDKVVGLDPYSTYPPNSTLPIVTSNSGFDISLEEIANISPQLVISPGLGYYPANEENSIVNTLHIPFIVMNPENVQQIENQTLELAQITGTTGNATLINAWMQSNLQNFSQHLVNISKELNVFYYLSTPGDWTAGNGTFINEFFTLAHLHNIAANESGYYVDSGENITVGEPQIILLDQYVNYSSITVPPFKSTPAVKQNRVYTIFNDNFFNEPDFRVIYAIGWLISKAYPENFNLSDISQYPISLQYPPDYNM